MAEARAMTVPGWEAAPVALLTGIPGAGKTSIGREAVGQLRAAGTRAELIDGDDLRAGLPPALGFSREERRWQAQRAGYVAELLSANGVIAIVSLVIPFRRDRAELARRFGDRFLEVWVRASLQTCAARDPHGVYRAAKARGDQDYAEVAGCYERPRDPDLVLDTDAEPLDRAALSLERALRPRWEPLAQASS
jgi:adenylylsulfate kinase-like enzyme